MTGTVHVVPLPDGPMIIAPVDPVPRRLKLEAFNPVTPLLKVTVKLTVVADVGLAPARVIETTPGPSVYDAPTNGVLATGALLSASFEPVALTILSPSDPVAVPTLALTL